MGFFKSGRACHKSDIHSDTSLYERSKNEEISISISIGCSLYVSVRKDSSPFEVKKIYAAQTNLNGLGGCIGNFILQLPSCKYSNSTSP
jgi:hypothetical protein